MLLIINLLIWNQFAFGHSNSEEMCLMSTLSYMQNKISYNSHYEDILNKLPNKEKTKFLNKHMEYLNERSKLNNEANTLLKNGIINNFKLCEKKTKLEIKIQKFWTNYIKLYNIETKK